MSSSAGLVDDVLVVRDIVVEFEGIPALSGASLTVRRGEVHALIGPNGAGKTTLANIVTGHVRPRAGEVELRGEALSGTPAHRARCGIGRKFQIPRVFPRLTAEENLWLARESVRTEPYRIHAVSEIKDIRGSALSHGWRQRLELQMVLVQDPELAVLDEPTAGMTKAERQDLASVIAARSAGLTYLIVEHDMDFVRAVADVVSFMHQGRVVVTGPLSEVEVNPLVREIYLGLPVGIDGNRENELGLQSGSGSRSEVTRAASDHARSVSVIGSVRRGHLGSESGHAAARSEPALGDPVLRVSNFTVFRGDLPVVRAASFSVQHSDAIGILGRNGAGKTTLLAGLMGDLRAEGEITAAGLPMNGRKCWERARSGIAIVPQGRGLLLNLTVADNFALAQMEEDGGGQELDVWEIFPALRNLKKRKAGLLSGGEQQQAAIARALLRRPKILLLDEPTEGLSPRLISEVTNALRLLLALGLALVITEQKSSVVSALCSRFLVLRAGEVVANETTSNEAIARQFITL